MGKRREIELKAITGPNQLKLIADIPIIKRHATGRIRSSKLTTVYFDTPNHALRQQGLSLRVREIDGILMQCLKQSHERLGEMLVRTEWEGPVPSENPDISVIDDKPILLQIEQVGIEQLEPVVCTKFQRKSCTLRFEDGSTATLDIDAGEIVAANASEPICEFELELGNCTAERLFDLASEILKTVPYRLSSISKASRGYALLGKNKLQPRKYVNGNFAKDTNFEQRLKGLVQHSLDHLKANEVVFLSTDNKEAVRQMGLSLTRLYEAVRLFYPTIPYDLYKWTITEAKWLTEKLLTASAWNVLADEVLEEVAQLYREDQGFDSLSIAVNLARQQSHRQVRDAIEAQRYTEFLLRLSAWMSSHTWSHRLGSVQPVRLLDSISEHCRTLLNKLERYARMQGRAIEELSNATLEVLHIATQRLCFAVDLFEHLYPQKCVEAYQMHLAVLHDGFGYQREVTAAHKLLLKLCSAAENQAPPAWAYAGGLTIDWHRHAAIKVEQKLMKDVATFLQTKPFWHGA